MPTGERTGVSGLLPEMVSAIMRMRGWLALLILLLGILAALEPSLAWMGKKAVDALRDDSASLGRLSMEYGIGFGVLFLLLALLKAAEKIVNKIVEIRLIITLQREYLDRRVAESEARDVSQVFYGSEVAKKGFEVLYKDGWKVTAQITSVAVWQMTLAPEWLPAIALSALPALAVIWFCGKPIQRLSQEILHLQQNLAGTTRRHHRTEFVGHQETLFRRFVLVETFKVTADDAIDILIWINLVLLIVANMVFDIGLLPSEIDPAQLTVVIINLKLLSDPLGQIGKVYSKWREAYPALIQVFRPHLAEAATAQNRG